MVYNDVARVIIMLFNVLEHKLYYKKIQTTYVLVEETMPSSSYREKLWKVKEIHTLST